MEPTKDRLNLIRSALAALQPSSLTVHDESYLHEGHHGAKGGGGHFTVSIVSPQFAGKPAIKRHQMIYEALGNLMQTDIHAISIQAKAPEE